ncbi:MAG: putative metal binding protein, partial [Bacillota bacterium]|nr:putative metal binding protein [Bacillota bacterium]
NQRNYGADVISRINYSSENEEGLNILKNTIISQLNLMIESLCNKSNVKTENIYDVCFVGNTTMIHFLLGLSCENIAMSPYIPVTNSSMVIEAKELGLITNGIVSVVSGISAYVGSDITAGIITCGMLDKEKYSLLLDIGTNGEMALGNKEEVVTCSTAAGPAFEGANIKHGMAGITGAICKINLSNEKIYETIGNEKPVGICGSGVLDCVAQMLKYNIIDETGRVIDLDDEELNEKFKNNLTEIDGIKQFIIAQKCGKQNQITFSQKDVREVQLAKSAISAGIQILLKEKNLKYEDIDTLYMGGGFGNYMDIESATLIGMIPKELKDKVKNIGNSAGSGAKAYLLSRNLREKSEDVVVKTRYIELSSNQDFQDFFIEGMMFE